MNCGLYIEREIVAIEVELRIFVSRIGKYFGTFKV
jgi:hypothetical protein